jgi:hypothetical protein
MSGHMGYAAVEGQHFRLAEGTELVLAQVTEPVEHGNFVSWSLLFRGPLDRPLEQGTHTLSHDELGEQALFLVPLGPADDAFEYEAVFSQHQVRSQA